MKYKVKSLYYIDYPIYNSLPSCDDELVCRIAACLYVRYRRIDSQSNLLDSCIEMASNIYTFKILHLYDYLQSEIMCKVRAKRFTKHIIHRQNFIEVYKIVTEKDILSAFKDGENDAI